MYGPKPKPRMYFIKNNIETFSWKFTGSVPSVLKSSFEAVLVYYIILMKLKAN